MLRLRLVDEAAIRSALAAIEPELYRFPSIDPSSFRRAVRSFLAGEQGD